MSPRAWLSDQLHRHRRELAAWWSVHGRTALVAFAAGLAVGWWVL